MIPNRRLNELVYRVEAILDEKYFSALNNVIHDFTLPQRRPLEFVIDYEYDGGIIIQREWMEILMVGNYEGWVAMWRYPLIAAMWCYVSPHFTVADGILE